MPPVSMQDFKEAGKVVELEDSNHANVCKPTNKQHRSYQELLEFVEDIFKKPEVHSPCVVHIIHFVPFSYLLILN